jgi:hypothetical protein
MVFNGPRRNAKLAGDFLVAQAVNEVVGDELLLR